MESMGVVVRRHIDYLILLIPIYMYSSCIFFFAASFIFVHLKNVFRSCSGTFGN